MRSSLGLRFAPSCALLRSTGKKICALLAALRSGSVFALELGRWASILLAWTVPGPRFALPERPFCGLPRCACASDAHFVELCQNPIKTESKRMSACLCETPPLTKKRRQRASRLMLRDSCVRLSSLSRQNEKSTPLHFPLISRSFSAHFPLIFRCIFH